MDTYSVYLLGVLTGIALTVVVSLIRSGIPLRALYGPKYAKLTIQEPTWAVSYKIDGRKTGKIWAIKQIRQVTKCGLREAKEMTEGKPLVLPRAQASELAECLQRGGVRVAFATQRRSY